MKQVEIYDVLPLISKRTSNKPSKDDVFAVLKEPIKVVFVSPSKESYNCYVEQPNGDLKWVTGLSRKKGGEKLTESVFKEFAEAAATTELKRRADDGDDSVEYFKNTEPIETTKEARDIFLDGKPLFN